MCIRDRNYTNTNTISNNIVYETTDEDLWSQKIQEIRDFRSGINREKLPNTQANQLIQIYERYRSVFSDEPGKVRNYQCTLQFRDTVELSLIHI